MQEELLRIKMQEELLICLWLFNLRYQIISPTVTITYTSAVNLSFFPPLYPIFPFFHYCKLFSYYSIPFSSLVSCLEPWIYA